MYFSQSVTDWLSDRTDYRDAIASKNSELWTDRIYIFTQEIELKVTWYLHIDQSFSKAIWRKPPTTIIEYYLIKFRAHYIPAQ